MSTIENLSQDDVEWKQSEILGEILDLNKEVEELQASINIYVEENRKLPKELRDKYYDESIESYFTYDL